MRHVTLDCHLIVFARPSSFFLCPVTRNGVGSGCPIYFWALIKAEKALQKPSGRGGWKLSDGVCNKFQQYCFSMSSPHPLWLEFSKKPSWAVLSLFTMAAPLLPKKHKRNRSYRSQPSSYACVYTCIPGLLSASHTLSYVADPEASYLALQGCLEKSTQFLLF